jgi:hypothetical protein
MFILNSNLKKQTAFQEDILQHNISYLYEQTK